MRRSIEELRTFYGDPKGALVRRILSSRLSDAWGTADGCDVLGLGYATPFLDQFSSARRVVAAMPGGQGAEAWTASGRNRTTLVNDRALPFPSGLFDRVLLVHAIEEADDAQALLNEVSRVLSPTGRVIVVCAARGGLWARTEATPFGHGRPFSRKQIEGLIRHCGLEPRAWSQALYVPPWRPMLAFSDGIEQFGRLFAPGTAGVILMEAGRLTYARPKVRSGLSVLSPAPALKPVPSLSVPRVASASAAQTAAAAAA
ncbi:class I SAM-dependent methyltransferase, partial [Brevundimonas sp. UBA5866]